MPLPATTATLRRSLALRRRRMRLGPIDLDGPGLCLAGFAHLLGTRTGLLGLRPSRLSHLLSARASLLGLRLPGLRCPLLRLTRFRGAGLHLTRLAGAHAGLPGFPRANGLRLGLRTGLPCMLGCRFAFTPSLLLL